MSLFLEGVVIAVGVVAGIAIVNCAAICLAMTISSISKM